MLVDGECQAVEGALTMVMATVGEYLQTWKLKLSTTAKRALKVTSNNEAMPFSCESKYLGGTLDRSLTYCRHLESFRRKLTSRIALLRRLAGSGWGDGTATQ